MSIPALSSDRLLRPLAELLFVASFSLIGGCRSGENVPEIGAGKAPPAAASGVSHAVKSSADKPVAAEQAEPNSQAGESKPAKPELSAEEEKAVIVRLVSAKATPLPARDKTAAQPLPVGVVVGFPTAPAGASEAATNFGAACDCI